MSPPVHWQQAYLVSKLTGLITISADVNRPSPGMIDAIEQAARMLHQEAFASDKENTSTQSDPIARPDSHARHHANETKECAACGR